MRMSELRWRAVTGGTDGRRSRWGLRGDRRRTVLSGLSNRLVGRQIGSDATATRESQPKAAPLLSADGPFDKATSPPGEQGKTYDRSDADRRAVGLGDYSGFQC